MERALIFGMGRLVEVEAQVMDGDRVVINPATAAQLRLGPIGSVCKYSGQAVPAIETLVRIRGVTRVTQVLIADVEVTLLGENLLGPEEVAARTRFMVEEYALLERLRQVPGLHEDSLIPLVMSIRGGGHWSILSGQTRAVSVVNRHTLVEEGRTMDDIYLLQEPVIRWREGEIMRLEVESGERYMVRRPYRVGVQSDVSLMATLDPRAKIIEVRDLGRGELLLTGSPAYALAHEVDHLEGRTPADVGEPLWTMRYAAAELGR